MQIEYVARVCFTSGRTVQQQRKGAVSHRMLGQVVINNEHVLALVHEIFADRAARVRRDILQRRGLGCGRSDNAGIIHCAVLDKRFSYLRNRRALLADGHIDTDHACALLVDDGIQADRGLAGLAVADDQLALSAADRDHGVDRLDAGLERYVYRCAFNDARRRAFDRARLACRDRALAVDRLAQRIDNAAEHGLAHRHLDDAVCAFYRVALTDILIRTQDNGADQILLQVLRHAVYAARKLEQLAGHAVFQTVDVGDAVTDRHDRADVGQLDLALVVRDLLFDNVAYLFGA